MGSFPVKRLLSMPEVEIRTEETRVEGPELGRGVRMPLIMKATI